MSASRYRPGAGELPVRTLQVDGARAEIHAHGAQLTSWYPAGEGRDRLYLSPRADFRAGAAIRGGVPVIFPQFAAEGPLPRHGFARGARWAPVEARDGDARAVLCLDPTLATHPLWPHDYDAELSIELQARSLAIRLTVRNSGTGTFAFTAALHSYFAVDDIAGAAVYGLQCLRYRDSAGGGRIAEERAPALRLDGEIDRIYFDVPPTLELREPQRRLRIRGTGFRDCVVWNPGEIKAATLADLEPGGFRRFVCIEAAAIGTPIRLEPGAAWEGAQMLETVPEAA